MNSTENKGWIKIHRSLLDWEWWDDHNTTRLFLYLLLKVNTEDKRWRGIEIKRGQLVTSVASMVIATGLTTKQVRIALDKLEKSNTLTIQTTNKFTLLTICNYADYQINQVDEGQTNGQAEGQTEGKQGANKGQQLKNKRIKEINNNNDDDNTQAREEKNENEFNITSVDDEYFEYMKTCEYWRQVVCMQLRIKEDKLDELLKGFYLECICTHHKHSNQRDCLYHFMNWSRSCMQREKQSTKRNGRTTVTSEELDRIVDAGLAIANQSR